MINEIKWQHIVNKVVFAQFVGNTLNMRKFRKTILSIGAKAVIQLWTSVKCYAKIAITKRRTKY